MGQGMAPTDEQNEDDADAVPLTALGEFMQRRNAELGLSVAAVAQRVGMSRATWYRIARGESASPGVRLLRGLARVYKVRAAELFALAAYVDTPASATGSRASGQAREAGDALWRCRYERQVRPGDRVDVLLELRNLSNQPWLGAEVRALHDGWLPLTPGSAYGPLAGGDGHDPRRSCAPLAPTGPGEWVQAQMALRAPPIPGPCVFCLVLYPGTAAVTAGPGVFLFVDAR